MNPRVSFFDAEDVGLRDIVKQQVRVRMNVVPVARLQNRNVAAPASDPVEDFLATVFEHRVYAASRRRREERDEPCDAVDGSLVGFGVRRIVIVLGAAERQARFAPHRQPQLAAEGVPYEVADRRHVGLPAESTEAPVFEHVRASGNAVVVVVAWIGERFNRFTRNPFE